MTLRAGSAERTVASGREISLYICRACGLIYDEAKGDADSGLAPGTRFADIPDDWACPLCGVTKADFEPYVLEEIVRNAGTGQFRAGAKATRGRARQAAGTVIVGAGRAGWQMAQALRARDASLPITLVTACNGDVYDKPLLSVAMARGIAVDKLPRESGADAARRLGVKLLAHTQAVRISPASRQLRTSRGTLRYQNLVLAHGAQARDLPQCPAALCWRINHLQAYSQFRSTLEEVPGKVSANVSGTPSATALDTVSASVSATATQKNGATPQRIAVIGAGLIGSEMANDLALAGHYITLLDIAARPLQACVPEAQSELLMQAWAGLPIQFVGGVQIASVIAIGEAQPHAQRSAQKNSVPKQITTQCGQVFVTDHIVVAAGLQTPNRLARSAGLAWNNGIDVQPETLATSVNSIHALGDCIAINGQVSRFIEPITRQAQTVAAAICGSEPVPFHPTRVPLRVKTGSLQFTV